MKAVPITAATLDLTWMKGQKVISALIDEVGNWYFSLSYGGPIQVQCAWRVIQNKRIVLSSDDHNQRFGLPKNIDSAEEFNSLLSEVTITDACLLEGTLDLHLTFSNGCCLEIIPLSRGYESWQINDPFGNYIVAAGGGRICSYKQ